MGTNETTTANVNPFACDYSVARAMLANHRNHTSKDIEACLKDKGRFAFTASTHALMNECGMNFSQLFALPQKQVKRAIQMVNAIGAKAYRDVDATSACGLYALHLAPDSGLSFDTLHYLASGTVRVDGATGDAKGVSRMKLSKLFARVGANTISTQKSRSFGDNGFCEALGMTSAPQRTRDRVVTLNRAHPLVERFVAMVESATDGQLNEIGGKGGDE